MGRLIVAAVLAYFVSAMVIAKRYCLRRHGLSARSGDVGAFVAGMVGLCWPISLRAVAALREAEGR